MWAFLVLSCNHCGFFSSALLSQFTVILVRYKQIRRKAFFPASQQLLLSGLSFSVLTEDYPHLFPALLCYLQTRHWKVPLWHSVQVHSHCITSKLVDIIQNRNWSNISLKVLFVPLTKANLNAWKKRQRDDGSRFTSATTMFRAALHLIKLFEIYTVKMSWGAEILPVTSLIGHTKHP